MGLWWISAALQAGIGIVSAPAGLDWKVAPVTSGTWSYRSVPGGSEAVFQDYRGPQLTLRCTLATRQVTVVRSGAQPGSALGVLTTSAQRSLPPGNTVSGLDPLLDAVAFSRGRFAIQSAGAPLLIVPTWPDAARSIEDCRK
ncbi:hypothetical protein ACFQPG_10425 [Sphingomonas sp. GCM10030256]|uniref:hypothetical protein n=1 Tax=Sphingomonas sp. GCM10030256 TaxID=3273427 RepID=UPI00360A1475